MQQLAAKSGVPLHLHAVIYQLIDQLKDELSAKLPLLTSESVLGKSSPCTLAPERLLPSPVASCPLAVQVKPRFLPPLTSLWGGRRFLWPAAVSRKVSWTAV